MAYPPTLPPSGRTNTTPQADNHPSDHNSLVAALSDIINELGVNPGGSQDVTTRLAPFTWTPPDIIIRASTGGAVKLGVATTDVVVVNATGASVSVPLNVQGITCTGITTNGGISASQQITCAARIQGWDLVLTGGGITLPLGGSMATNASLLQFAFGSSILQLSNTTLAVIPAAPGTDWNTRPLYVQGPLAGVGFHSTSISKAGSIQLYTSGVASAGFHFVNGTNSAYFSLHAFKFVEATPPGLLRETAEWDGNGLNVCRRLRPHVMRAADEDMDGSPVLGRPTLGFLPAQVREHLPEVVELDDTGTPFGLAISGFIPVLADAVRRLDRRLDRLERDLEHVDE